jgi:hypothetical protein
MNKFKVGDKVVNKRGVRGKVFKIEGKKVHFRADYGTEFDAHEDDLKFYYPQYVIKPRLNPDHRGDYCPRCKEPWTRTSFGSKVWYHCKKCNKKAEDLILGHSSPPPLPSDAKKGSVDDDLLKEFEQLLSGWGDDDFDDWF